MRDAETKQATIAELAKKILEGDKAKDQNLAALRETVHQQTNVGAIFCSVLRAESIFFICSEKNPKIPSSVAESKKQ